MLLRTGSHRGVPVSLRPYYLRLNRHYALWGLQVVPELVVDQCGGEGPCAIQGGAHPRCACFNMHVLNTALSMPLQSALPVSA